MRLRRGIKTLLLVSFLTILIFSAFSLIPKKGAGDNTYDFTGVSRPSSTHIAYQGTDSNQPPTSMGVGSELASGEYSSIANSDNICLLKNLRE